MPITEAARAVNFQQRKRIVEKLQTALKTLNGKTIGILGLAFKPKRCLHALTQRRCNCNCHRMGTIL